MELLLGSFVEVVLAKNKCHQTISGYVVHEAQSKNNNSIVVYTKNKKFKRIDDCLLKINEKYLWSSSRENRLIKKIRLKLSTI